LFAIQLVLKPASETERIVTESIVANNFISTYLDTVVVDCFESSLRELLKDCALGATIQCPGNANSCVKAKIVTDTILNRTMDTWKKSYNFVLEGSASLQTFNTRRGKCTGQRESSKPYAVPVKPGLTITLRVEICER